MTVTWFEIQTLEAWGRALYISVTEAPRNTEFYKWMGEKHFCFYQTAETGKRTPISSVKGSGAIYHYLRAPALVSMKHTNINIIDSFNEAHIECTYQILKALFKAWYHVFIQYIGWRVCNTFTFDHLNM